MVVRVKVNVREPSGGEELEVAAIANAGYESENPEISLPMGLAETLKIKTQNAHAEDFITVAGPITLRFLDRCLEVSLKIYESTYGPILSDVALSPSKGEVLLGDKLISALGIELIDPGNGIWRLSGEEKKRESVAREVW